MAIEDMLMSLGCEIVGPAYSIGDGQALAESEPFDAAVLDINIGGQSSDSIAQTLQSRGIPFCFSTGYGLGAVPSGFDDRPVLQKPYTLKALARTLEEIIG